MPAVCKPSRTDAANSTLPLPTPEPIAKPTGPPAAAPATPVARDCPMPAPDLADTSKIKSIGFSVKWPQAPVKVSDRIAFSTDGENLTGSASAKSASASPRSFIAASCCSCLNSSGREYISSKSKSPCNSCGIPGTLN